MHDAIRTGIEFLIAASFDQVENFNAQVGQRQHSYQTREDDLMRRLAAWF
jgi:hypothetical protein